MSLFNRLKEGLKKSREGLVQKVDQVLVAGRRIDEEVFEELEEILITSDVGINTTSEIIDRLRQKVREQKLTEGADVKQALKDLLKEMLEDEKLPLYSDIAPVSILIVGVNGTGKTTTIGKLAAKFKKDTKRVLLAAGDTFRAAAIEQLEEWAHRVGVEIVKNSQGSDPASVIFDAIQAAKARKVDVLICDTAGRLHNKKNLMEELRKIQRIINRELEDGMRETFLVLDATTGQNALVQARMFKETVDVTGVVLTKLDGTAKGGIVFAIKNELGIPVRFVGVGEGIEDLQPFDSESFVEAIFS